MQSENSVPLCEKATGNQERLSILRNESHLNSKLAAVDLGADDPLSPVESGSSSAECGIKKISYSILYRDKASQGEYAFDSKPITITESPVKCLSIPARLRSPLPLCASSPQPISIECRDSGATPGNLHDQTNRPTFANISSEDESTLLGSIEFELFYCPSAKQLKIYLLRAKNLISMDKNGFSDPYVKLHLIPGPSKATKLTSRTIEKTLNPEWNEVFTYHGICEDDKFKKSLRIIVMDRDRIKSDFLGETRVMLKKLPNNTRKHFNLYLERAMPVPTDKGKANRERGKLLVAIVYNVQQGSLFVTIKRCAELLGMDPTGFSDPYVKVMLTPLSNKSHRQRTSIKKRTLNPEFNETFAFMVPFKDLPMKTLQIGVYDHDIAKHDDYIGSVILSVSAKGDRQKQWIDCMQNPGDVCEYWHRIELE